MPIQKLELEPYTIIKYEMKKLSHSEKMRLTRLLYGKETEKVYKEKTYASRKKRVNSRIKRYSIGEVFHASTGKRILDFRRATLRIGY